MLDNLSRRDIDNELGCSSLTPIETPEVRVKAWEKVSGKTMRFVNLDVAKDFAELVQVRLSLTAFVRAWWWWWWCMGTARSGRASAAGPCMLYDHRLAKG